MSATLAGLGRVRAAWNLRTSPGRMLSRGEARRTLLDLADEVGVAASERARLHEFPTLTRDMVSGAAVSAWLGAQQEQLAATPTT